MNIYRPQKPYRFRPPRPAWWFLPVLHLLARQSLRFKFNVRRIDVAGAEGIQRLAREGHSVLVAPNHADHADPAILVEAGRRHGLAFHFMAAREGFEHSAVAEYVLQRAGAFSVDREGADLAAVKTAIGLLRAPKRPLVIFPEGQIYHHHEQLDELNEGVANIALRAAEKPPPGRSIHLVPAAIRISHDPGIADTFAARMDALERGLTWKPATKAAIADRIYRYGGAMLGLKEAEFIGRPQEGDLVERIQRLQRFIVERVESRHGGPGGDATIPERIKALRQAIRKRLHADEAPRSAAETESLYDDLDELFVAQQLYSYPGTYLRSEPTVDRIAETIFKLEEDVLGVQRYPAPRHARVVFGEPIDIAAFMSARQLKPRAAVQPLTEQVRVAIEGLLAGAPATA